MTTIKEERDLKDKRNRKVWLTSSEKLSKICDLLPSNKGRQSLVSSLIKAYKLDSKCESIINVSKIKRKDLEVYHDKGFLDCLLRKRPRLNNSLSNYKLVHEILRLDSFKDEPYREELTSIKEDVKDTEKIFNKKGSEVKYESDLDSDMSEIESEEEESEDNIEDSTEDTKQCEIYGLRYDCYVFPFMADYVKLVASSSICTAKRLIQERSQLYQNIAINWYGGRHHCAKRRAEGFCYINDIILSIIQLRKVFGKVFYLDLDLHHGDGVENGYEYSKNVMTCSVHRYDVGFYPGTGSLECSSKTKINIPTKRGLSDDSMLFIINEIVIPLIKSFDPGVLIIQAGCDGLGADEHKEWNLTIKGYGKIIETLINSIGNIPTMVLGGGGYNHTETAKCWTYITKVVLGVKEEWDLLPEHEYVDEYEVDGFQFWTMENRLPKNMKDENDESYLQGLKLFIKNIFL